MELKVQHKITTEFWEVIGVKIDKRFTIIELSDGITVRDVHYDDLYFLYDVPASVSKYIANEAFKQLGGRA